MRSSRLLVATALLSISIASMAPAAVESPDQHLGRRIGTDFTLADWKEVSSYYSKLAQQSPNVKVSVEGKTTEGRDFLVAVISSEANLKNLDAIKGYARTIADPRGKTTQQKQEAIKNGKVILAITPAMHSTECAAPQMGMEFAYQLATSEQEPWKSARENIVVVMPATLNPDGLDHVVEWYRKIVNTPYEASAMLKLYQYYTGHDNNRDWFMFSQAETRIMSRLIYREWIPQIYWDVHQQGNDAERLFLPPYRDPLNPTLDPAIVASINLIGTRAVMDLTRQGFTGVATDSEYDMWFHGGNRGVPVRHNMIGILSEAASANLASPIFQKRSELKSPQGKDREYGPSNEFLNPWPGGWWRIRDIIDYELAFGRSLLGTISREPQTWLTNTMEAAERAVARGQGDGVRGWVIPANDRDPDAARRLVDAVMQAGIEVHTAVADLTLDGRKYPAGSIVIRRDQPWATHVKDLFDIQRYPAGSPPYDVAGWTLPLLMGVRRVEVMQAIDAPLKRILTAEEATAAFVGDTRLKDAPAGTLSTQHSSAWTEAARRLKENQKLWFVASGPDAGLIKTAAENSSSKVATVPMTRLPRIGVYAPWSASMDEGWLRYVLDTWKIPYTSVRNETIRAGKLNEFLDVLVIADLPGTALEGGRPSGTVPEEYAGGLSPEGSVAIDDFVRAGGTLITFKSASRWAIHLFELPLVDATSGEDANGFSCPGSILRGIPAVDDLTAGLPSSLPLMFSTGSGWHTSSKATDGEKKTSSRSTASMKTLLSYAPTELLLSGYIAKPNVLEGRSAWVRAEHGRGAVHLFGFQPHYRSWSQGTFGLLFRAMLLEEPPQK